MGVKVAARVPTGTLRPSCRIFLFAGQAKSAELLVLVILVLRTTQLANRSRLHGEPIGYSLMKILLRTGALLMTTIWERMFLFCYAVADTSIPAR